MHDYEIQAENELIAWQKKMLRKPTLLNRLSARIQQKLNGYIPEKVHNGITNAIRQLFKVVLFGSKLTSARLVTGSSLNERESMVRVKIRQYKNAAAAEGGITGAGGFLAGLADFPLLLSIKIKLLYDVAAIYGFDTSLYHERVYLLLIFQLAFSTDETRRDIYLKMQDWNNYSVSLPSDIDQFDWRTFQQEYRDYIDLAKLAQMLPIVGAPVGAVVNYRLLKKLGTTAMNAYRLRWPFQRLIAA